MLTSEAEKRVQEMVNNAVGSSASATAAELKKLEKLLKEVCGQVRDLQQEVKELEKSVRQKPGPKPQQ